jgi:hypothetical protein
MTQRRSWRAHPRHRVEWAGPGGGESFLRVHWVAVPEALRARRVNRRGSRPRWEYLERPDAEPLAMTEVCASILMIP